MADVSLKLIKDAVRAAGEMLVRVQHYELNAQEKLDGSVVTTADLESERLILAAIQQIAPMDSVVAEESGTSTQSTSGRTWHVDPLDGTAQYVLGLSDFAILVSQWSVDRPLLSVVSFPATSDWAFVHEGAVVELSGHSIASNSIHLCYTDSASLRDAAERLSLVVHDHFESTRALFDVAAGVARGAVVRLWEHQSWDLAALVHLLMASGALVANEHGEIPAFSGARLDFRWIVAAADKAAFHELMAATLSEIALSS